MFYVCSMYICIKRCINFHFIWKYSIPQYLLAVLLRRCLFLFYFFSLFCFLSCHTLKLILNVSYLWLYILDKLLFIIQGWTVGRTHIVLCLFYVSFLDLLRVLCLDCQTVIHIMHTYVMLELKEMIHTLSNFLCK